MNATEFQRRRSRIEHGPRPSWWKRKALQKLIHEAVAVPVHIAGRVIGWQLHGGQVVCVKQRFKDEPHALTQLAMIRRCHHFTDKVPVRAYHCPHCHGWHLTSRE